MGSNPVSDEARELPREPAARWIVGLFTASAVLWLGVLAWQVIALPEMLPVQFDFSGEPTSWWSKASALGFAVLMAAVLVLPAATVPGLVFRAPRSISAPNSDWWTATPRRLRRFERLLREDLLLLAVTCLALLAVGQVGMTLAANSANHALPVATQIAFVVPVLGMIVVIIRMCGGGGRYDRQDGLE